MEPIRILIADDDPGMRTVMRLLVERSEGYLLSGEAADGDELLRLYGRTHPQVILMDVEMPGMSGIDCARVIQDRAPRTRNICAARLRCTRSTIWSSPSAPSAR